MGKRQQHQPNIDKILDYILPAVKRPMGFSKTPFAENLKIQQHDCIKVHQNTALAELITTQKLADDDINSLFSITLRDVLVKYIKTQYAKGNIIPTWTIYQRNQHELGHAQTDDLIIDFNVQLANEENEFKNGENNDLPLVRLTRVLEAFKHQHKRRIEETNFNLDHYIKHHVKLELRVTEKLSTKFHPDSCTEVNILLKKLIADLLYAEEWLDDRPALRLFEEIKNNRVEDVIYWNRVSLFFRGYSPIDHFVAFKDKILLLDNIARHITGKNFYYRNEISEAYVQYIKTLLQNENSKLHTQNSIFSDLIGIKNETIIQLEQKNKELGSGELEQEKRKNSELKIKNSALEDENKKLTSQVSSLTKQLKETNSSLVETMKKMEETNDKLEQTQNELRDTKKELLDTKEEMKTQFSKIDEKRDEDQRKMAELIRQVSTLQGLQFKQIKDAVNHNSKTSRDDFEKEANDKKHKEHYEKHKKMWTCKMFDAQNQGEFIQSLLITSPHHLRSFKNGLTISFCDSSYATDNKKTLVELNKVDDVLKNSFEEFIHTHLERIMKDDEIRVGGLYIPSLYFSKWDICYFKENNPNLFSIPEEGKYILLKLQNQNQEKLNFSVSFIENGKFINKPKTDNKLIITFSTKDAEERKLFAKQLEGIAIQRSFENKNTINKLIGKLLNTAGIVSCAVEESSENKQQKTQKKSSILGEFFGGATNLVNKLSSSPKTEPETKLIPVSRSNSLRETPKQTPLPTPNESRTGSPIHFPLKKEPKKVKTQSKDPLYIPVVPLDDEDFNLEGDDKSTVVFDKNNLQPPGKFRK